MHRCDIGLLLVFLLTVLCLPDPSFGADAQPGPPVLMSPNNESVLSPGSSLKLQVSSGHGLAPTAYRFVIRNRHGGQWSSPWISGVSNVVWTTPIMEVGEYWWTAQAMNRYGASHWQQSQMRFFVRHPLFPPQPLSPAKGAVVPSRTVTFSWADSGKADHRGALRIYRLRVWTTGGWSYDSQWTIRGTTSQVTIPSHGEYWWAVAAHDGFTYSTFSGQRQFSLDSEPPKINISGPAALQWTNRDSLSWSVTDAIGRVTEVTLQWDGSPQQSVAASGTTTIPEGKRSVIIRAKDEAENASSGKGGPYWVDVTPPAVSIDFHPTRPQRKDTAVPDGWMMIVQAEDRNGSGVAARYYSINGREFPYDAVPVTISEVGTHNCSARVIDKAGNSATASRTVTVDAPPLPPKPPPQPVVSPSPGWTTNEQPAIRESRQQPVSVPAPVVQPKRVEQQAPAERESQPAAAPVEKTEQQPVEHPQSAPAPVSR